MFLLKTATSLPIKCIFIKILKPLVLTSNGRNSELFDYCGQTNVFLKTAKSLQINLYFLLACRKTLIQLKL
ncbi:hypothetical protein DOY81_002165 [Sarcophaga bullata]|nr:hypothetical protein DOY81_002165 [Sarcophaga bullata]